MTIKTVRVALFIDAENTRPSQIGQALAYCDRMDRVSIRRIYGNATSLTNWAKIAAENCVVPMQTPPSATKENASDFALTLDAAALLHRGLFDHAVIMSSDADFIQLAMHIREHGIAVSGIGEAKTPKSMRSAFDEFIVLAEEKPEVAAKVPKKIAAKPIAAPAAKVKAPKPAAAAAAPLTIATSDLLRVYDELRNGDQAVEVQAMGTRLAKLHRHYKRGFKTASNFLAKSGVFTVNGKFVYRNPI